MKRYYLTGFVRIEATDDADALAKFEAAGLGVDVEVIDGVWVDFEGGWDEIVDVPDVVCICPPDLVERGGFKGDCPVHA